MNLTQNIEELYSNSIKLDEQIKHLSAQKLLNFIDKIKLKTLLILNVILIGNKYQIKSINC